MLLLFEINFEEDFNMQNKSIENSIIQISEDGQAYAHKVKWEDSNTQRLFVNTGASNSKRTSVQ